MGYPPSKMGFEPSSPRYGPFLEWAQQPSPAQSGHQKYTYQFRVVRGPMAQFRGVETTQSGGFRVGYPPSKMGFEPSSRRYGQILLWHCLAQFAVSCAFVASSPFRHTEKLAKSEGGFSCLTLDLGFALSGPTALMANLGI